MQLKVWQVYWWAVEVVHRAQVIPAACRLSLNCEVVAKKGQGCAIIACHTILDPEEFTMRLKMNDDTYDNNFIILIILMIHAQMI